LVSCFVFVAAPKADTVQATGTIYIRANGIVEGTASIWTADNATYFFDATIHDSIIVERNNIVLDGNGYRLQGAGNGTGISLSSRNNVTVKNTIIVGWGSVLDPSATTDSERWVWGIAISIGNSRSTNIVNNTVSNNCMGIFLTNSNSSSITGNHASSNSLGIYLNGY
jgi:parallel beta-helix repeat protein